MFLEYDSAGTGINDMKWGTVTQRTLVNNLTETVTGKVLDATQGKVLDGKIVTARATTGSDAALFKFTFVGGVLNIKPTT